MTRRKLQNTPKIALHGNRHSSAPIKVPGCHFKDNMHSYLKRELSDKCQVVGLDEVLVYHETHVQYFKDQHILKGIGNIQKNHSKHLLGMTS